MLLCKTPYGPTPLITSLYPYILFPEENAPNPLTRKNFGSDRCDFAREDID
jgi:hypothetical protein